MSAAAEPFAAWAILELMGHRERPGFVQEVEVAGGKMLRVDIHFQDGAVVSEFYGTQAVYSLRPCTEDVARRAMRSWNDPRPVAPLDFRRREEPHQLIHDTAGEI